MTRNITLADIMPSRTATTAKSAADSGATQAARQPDDVACFAQLLENAGKADGKGGTGDEQNERHYDARHNADASKVPGHATPTATAPTVRSLVPTTPLHDAPPSHYSPPVPCTADSVSEPPTPRSIGAASPVVGRFSSDASVQAVRPQVGTSAAAVASTEPSTEQTATTALPAAEVAASPRVPSPLNGTPARPVAFVPAQIVVPSSSPATPRDDAGRQACDSDGGTGGDAQATPVRLSGTEAAASPSVVVEPMTTPLVTTTFGEFAVHLDQATSLEGAQQSPRSDFVASNAVLTAAISKPCNEGNGVYSVTAMLNPPSLGHVQAVVKVDGTNVNVSIVAHTPEGHHAIAGHLDELRGDLEARGGDVQLSLSDGGGTGRQRDQAEPPTATTEDSEDPDALVLTVAPAQTAESLHVIL